MPKTQRLVLCGQKEYREMHESTHAIAAALPNGKAYQVTYPKGVPLREQHNWSMTFPELFTPHGQSMDRRQGTTRRTSVPV